MEYAKLGNTDIEVSKLCIGCMSFGKAGTMHDWTLDAQESEKVILVSISLILQTVIPQEPVKNIWDRH